MKRAHQDDDAAIRVRKAPSYDRMSSYELTLTVSDSIAQVSGSGSVEITVDPPPCSIEVNGDTLSVREDAAAGTLVGDVEVNASNCGNLTYSLTGPGADDFSVEAAPGTNNHDGRILVASALDHETDSLHHLALTVSHGTGTASHTASVLITVTDVNEPPRPKGRIGTRTVLVGDSGTVDVAGYFEDEDEGDQLRFGVSASASAVGASVGGSTVTYWGESVGSATVTITATDLGRISADQPFVVNVTEPPNRPPEANAGPDQHVQAGDSVHLDGTGSSDSDGTIERWLWAGRLELRDSTTSTPSFEAPSTIDATAYTFTLKVWDDDGATATDDVVVTVHPCAAPTANAGPDQRVRELERVTLNGSGSTGATSYTWTQAEGPAVTLTGASSAQASFNAPQVTGDALLRFRLTVANGCGDDSDEVEVTVQDNRGPVVASSIPAQGVAVRAEIEVDVSGRFRDPDGDALSFAATSADTTVARAGVSGSVVTVTGVSGGAAA